MPSISSIGRLFGAWLLLVSVATALVVLPAAIVRADASAGPLTAAADIDVESRRLFVPDGGGFRPRGTRSFHSGPSRMLGPRSAWFVRLFQDSGPEPRIGVVRQVVDARAGIMHAWPELRVTGALDLRTQLFSPEDFQLLPESYRLRRMHALMIEAVIKLDLRDRERDPRRGLYVRLALQQAGASSWTYLRATADVRGYLPLPGRMVLAARFAWGGMFVLNQRGLNESSLHELDLLGPLSEQLQGGGISSHRGYRRGGLGAVRRAVTATQPNGSVAHYRPVLITGGTLRWEGSIELRIPLGKELGAVLFADLGSVNRGLGDLTAVSSAWGIGLRRRTKLGMLRLEWAFRPDLLQHPTGGGPRACVGPDDIDCRPSPSVGKIPGAVHLSFAEPF